MSSTGQIVGGIVGGVIGFFFLGGNAYAGAIKGAAIGASIGGYIDPPPAPNLSGPTLDDKSFQSTAYGVSLATLHGSIATTGNIIYLENNEYKAVARKESTGGKGGGSQGSYTTTTYYATFAVALGEAMPGTEVRRIWAGGKLIYSANNEDLSSLLQSAAIGSTFRYYDGSQSEPDSRMESVVGVGRTPSYEGTAYIILYDFDLTDFGNGLAGAPIKVELVPRSWADQVDALAQFEILMGGGAQPPSSCNAYMGGKSHVFDASIVSFEYEYYYASASVLNASAVERVQLDLDDGQVNFAIPGHSERNAYWYYREVYDGDDYVVIASNGVDVYASDVINFTMAYVLDESSVGLHFCLAAEDNTDLRIYDSAFEEFISLGSVPGAHTFAVGDGAICFINDIGSGVLSLDLISSSLIEIKTFTVSVGAGAGLRNDYGSSALIVNGLIYVSGVGNPDLGELIFYVIDIDAEELIKTITVSMLTPIGDDVIGGHSTMTYIGSGLFAWGIRGGSINQSYSFVFAAIGATSGGVAPVPLHTICSQYIGRAGITSGFYDVSSLTDDVFGYRFSGPGSARGALSALQVAYLFDFVELGYTLTAIKRGGSSDEVVPYQHLNARKFGEAVGILIEKNTETDSQLPSRYSITYLDYNREYDTNTQYADFPSRRVNERNESLALVMNADHAAQLADVLGNLAWMERDEITFTLPQLYLAWRVGDVKTVEVAPGVNVVLRVNDLTYNADQIIEVSAKLAEPAIYASGAVGVPALPPPETIPFIGDSIAVLMDIPMMLDSTDSPGYVATMFGYGSWPGGVLFRSYDEGQSYSGIQSFTGPGTVARAGAPLGISDGFVIDRESVLAVTPLSGEFAGITEAQMLTGQNYCAYGVDGRWEIIQYAGSVLNANGTRTLSTFVRGLRGTEWAAGLHQADDLLILLDDIDNVFIGSDINYLSVPHLYRAVTFSQSVVDADDFSFAWGGVNLRPLSPVLADGEVITNDWHISWTPRTRYTSSFWVSGNQPQNESVMAWQVDIYDGGVVVRTIDSATPDVIYSEEQQVADFGMVQSSLSVAIYQISQRVGRGYPLEAEF